MEPILHFSFSQKIRQFNPFLCLFFFMFASHGFAQQLSGTYIIGASGDYTTFNAAVSALTTNGVSGPVIFEVQTGTYSEQVVLGTITGSSATNTITFQSQSGNASDVDIRFGSTSTSIFTVRLEGASHLRFKNLRLTSLNSTNARILAGTGTINDLIVENVVFTAPATTSTLNSRALVYFDLVSSSNLQFLNNSFNGGSTGIIIIGSNDINNPAEGIVVAENTFRSNQFGAMDLSRLLAPRIEGNDVLINSSATNSTSLILSNIRGAVQILNNKFIGSTLRGITLTDVVNTSGTKSLVANNFIAGATLGTNHVVRLDGVSQLNFYHNSLHNYGAGNGIYFVGASGSGVRIINNLIKTGAGLVLDIASASGLASLENLDYNGYFNTGSNIVRLGSGFSAPQYTSLESWQSASGSFEQNSLFGNPFFASNTDLRPASTLFESAGTVLPEVTTDIDSESRSATPSIGAVEYLGIPKVPLAGTYTINSSGSGDRNYTSVGAAVDALNFNGISDAVIFNLASGTYTGQQHQIFPIEGTSSSKTVTFQSQSGDPGTVTISFTPISTANYVISLVGASHLRFKNLSITSTGTSTTLGKTLVASGVINDFVAENVRFTSANATTTNRNNVDFILGNNSTAITFENCQFTAGYNGLSISRAMTSDIVSDILIKGSTIRTSNLAGISLQGISNLVVDENDILLTTTVANSRPITVGNITGSIQITSNKFIGGAGNSANFQILTATSLNKGLIANNFFSSAGAVSVDLGNFTNINFYHNSIVNSGTGIGLQSAGGIAGIQGLRIINNLIKTGSGAAIRIANTAPVESVDYNGYFTSGSVLGILVNTGIENLSDWQLATGFDANTLNFDPQFISTTDLHASAPAFASTGIALAEVTQDIDGESRDGVNPSRGADEYTAPPLVPMSGEYTINSGISGDRNFQSFDAAINAMISNGINGAVVFKVATGTYTERVTIPGITGISASNSITFESASGNPADVNLLSSATSTETNFVLRLDNAKHVRLRNFTVGTTIAGSNSNARVIDGINNLKDILIENCVLNSNVNTNTSFTRAVFFATATTAENIQFINNKFVGGSHGIYLRLSDLTISIPGLRIEGNEFSNFTVGGIDLNTVSGAKILSNTLTTSSTSSSKVGVNVNVPRDGLELVGNKVFYNRISISNGTLNTAENPGIIANNFIFNNSIGAGLSLNNVSYFQVYHNSISSNGSAFDYIGMSGRLENRVKNNVFRSNSNYSVTVTTATGLTEMDFNDLFSGGANLSRWNGTNATSLAAWRTLSSFDANSINEDPLFVSETDLTPQNPSLSEAGTDLTSVVPSDINGIQRTVPVSIGAIEYSVAGLPMEGDYTIDPSGVGNRNFTGFASASEALQLRGVSGAVRFLIADGTYQEQLNFGAVNGTSEDFTISLESASGNPENVIIQYPIDYVLRLENSEHYSIKNLTFKTTGVDVQVIQVNDRAVNLLFENNIIQNIVEEGSSDTRKGIVVTGNFRENIRIINNQISGGFYGIQVSGSSLSNLAPGVVISGNTITNTSFRSIFLTYNSAPEVSGNRIQTNSTLLEQVAILLENNSNGLLFKENRIESKGGYAIRMNNVTGSASESNLVYNNFLVSEGNLSAVVFSNTTFVDFYHNSVWNRNTGSAFYYFSNGADNKLVNNIFQANTGYSARIESPFAISESNFNNFFNEGMSLGRWGGTDVSNLSNWISTSGKDQNSLSVDSKFVSISDLTPQEGALGINGTDLSSIVENDINGISRTAPFSIGAVQFTAEEAVDIALVQILTPSSNCLLSEQESITVRVSNTGISLAGNISLGYQINDLEPVIEALDPSVVLTPGLTFDYTFLQKAGLSQKGDYSIRVFLAETDEDATNNEVQKSISHFAQPELTLIPEVTICKGQSVVLEAFGVGSFLWNTGSTDRVISVSPLEDTFYTVTLTDQNGCTSEKSVTVIVLETPILEYVGDEGFESSFVSPELGVQNTEFIYRVNYINQNGIFPSTGFPRLTVQSFLETREIIMVEEDPSDTDVTDGKIYRAITTNLSDQVSWSSKIEVQFQAGCPVSTGFFEGPIVSDDFLDVAIFATDILFSNDEPAFNEEFTITAIVRNTSDFVAENFVVSVYDDANLIASTVVDYLEPQSTKEVSWNYSFSISGYHEIKVVLDETEVLDEKNELNNFAIRFYALPEGINVTASLNKTVLLLGESISVSGLATYFGLDLAVTPKVSKAEVTITHSDGRVRNLNTNTNGGFSASFSGPSELGVYTISGQVDDGRFVVPFGPLQFEVVENDDNEPILLPDLESKITLVDPVGRAHYLRGESISGVARVTNKGQAPAQNFVFRYSSCEGVIGEVFIPILQPGEFIEYPFVTSVLSRLNSCSRESSENCLFTATADPLRQVVESSRSNNNASIGKQVYAELPDLIPARSSASTFNLEDNYDLTIWARNLGGLETVNPFNINVYVDGVLTDTRTITENVAVCAFVKSYKLSFLFENTEEKEIRIVVDDPYGSGAINEYNETNNEIKFKITYEPKKPDLFTNLGWLSIEPAIPQPGQLFKIKARFGNYGDEDISVPFFNSFIIKENGVETVFENEIAGGAIKNVNKSDSIFTSISTYGNNSLEFRTDSRSEITESDETNNSVFVPLCVELSPIIPTTLSGPIDAWAGGFQVFTEQFLTVVVRNSGLFEGENVSVKFYLNDQEIASTVVPKIVRTSSNTFVRLPYIFTEAGIFNLKVVVDAEGNLNECDEENNTFSKTIEILTPGPDLRVLTQYISPTKINPDLDEEINLFVSYDNIGIVPSGPFKVRLLIDGQQIGEDVQVEGVGAGEDGTVAITEPYSSPIGGIKTIQAIVDILEEQPDPNRSNNSALRTIFVGDAPNLKFTNLVFSNNCPENGDNLTITATIGNEGDVSTEATLKFYYKSGETLEEISEQLISVDAKGSVQVSIPLVLLSNTFSIYAEITDAYPFEYNLLDNSIEKAFCADILNEFELTTSVIGEGIILRNPNQVLYEEGSVVSLSAIPAEGWSFNQWSGDGAGSQNPLSFTFDAAKNVVAEFIENYRIKLNVTNESCFESADGRLEVNIFAGFAPYTIQWFKNGELLAASGNVIDNLSQGLYEVRVTDSNDQLLSSSAEIIVGDFQFPVIVIPAEISLTLDENGEAILNISDLNDESFDNCGIKAKSFNNGVGTLTFDCSNVGTSNSVDFKVEDTNGNVSVKSFNVKVQDQVLPTITNVPANIEMITDARICGAVVTWTEPSADDNCGIESFTVDFASGTVFPVGETTVTYTAMDIHGNTETASFTVTVNDTEKPTITNVPTNIEMTADAGVCGAVVTWTEPSADDNCGIESLTADFASGTVFPVGETTVTYMAADIHGNTETASFTVTVSDLEKPVITNMPTNIEVNTDPGVCGAVVTWTEPSADDNCEIESFTADFASGTVFPVGETTVTYTATDINGNTETASFTVTVTDLEKPVSTNMPTNIEVNTDPGVCGAAVTWTEPSADDNCGIESFTADFASGTVFPVGETTVTYTATDIHGNAETSSFTVTVSDLEKPVITNMPVNIEISTGEGICGAVVTWTEPSADDNCEIESFTADHTSGDLFPVGETTVTYTATDIHGIVETASFTVTVSDLEKPVITNMPVNIEVSTGEGICGAVVTWTEPSADDNCEIESFIADYSSGDLFQIGETTVTYTAKDIHGNTETASFTVIVTDLEKPLITNMPTNIEVNTDLGVCGAVVTWTEPNAADNCEIESFSADYSSGDLFQIGETTVTYTAKDIHGNTETASFTVTVTDLEKPVITNMPTIIEVNTDPGVCEAVVTWTEPNAADNCGIESFTADYTSGSEFPVGETTVTYTATDIHGNTETAIFTVKVIDGEKPQLAYPSDISSTVEFGSTGKIITYDLPIATDNCGTPSLELIDGLASGEIFPVGQTTVIYRATDVTGNTADCSFTVTITESDDNEDPIISDCPEDFAVNTDPGICGAVVTWIEPTSTDNSGSVTLVSNFEPGSIFPVGTTQVVYIATDDAGNQSTCTFNVTVNDIQAPTVITRNRTFTINPINEVNLLPSDIDNGTSDNCGVQSLELSKNLFTALDEGENTITLSAIDVNGNMAIEQAKVTILINAVDPGELDGDGDGYTPNQGDCDDSDDTVYPGAPELCDGKDNNCDGTIDEGVQTAYYLDADGDGFGDVNAEPLFGCSVPDGYVTENTDCDDSDDTVYPGALELCDGKDNNCDGTIDEGVQTAYYLDADGDGFGDVNAEPLFGCSVPDGYVTENTDCDDSDDTVYPGALELCDGKDNNCDGTIDEGVQTAYYIDSDGDSFGDANGDPIFACSAPEGYVGNNLDCDDSDPSINPDVPGACASDPCGETIEIGSISGPLDPVQVNNPITVFAQISGEVMSAKWIWDNGDETVLSKPFGDFATQYTYSTPGVYQIRLVLADACGNETLGLTDLAVIFDPNGGFITGGGWIWSPKGAYQVDQEAEGRANFGFVAKYRKGSNKVDGNTEFQFRNGNLNFNSTSHEEMSLVIAGHRGIYKGKGTINREEGYSFMVSAIDGNLQDPVESDKFRIKIWETASGSIVYDNQLGTSDNAVATSAISGGNIVIHQPQKGKNKSIDPSGLVQVAWNTPIEELKDYTVLYELEEEAIGVMVDWKEEGYNPLVPGIYEITGKVKQLSSNRVIPMNSFSMYVLVMDKTMPLDISLSNQKISKDLKSGQVVGILQTEDPADNIHTYTLAPSADFELDGNQVVWIGDGELRNEYTISVTSIDRVGQSISKDIPITREIDTNQVTIYPNPASKETHVKVDLVQSNEVSIRVYDSAGRLMFEESGYRERGFILNVDLQTWSAGLYQIQVQIGFETITKRLVKIE